MVQYCVGYGCKTLHDKRNNDINFHSFPFNRPEILKLWVAAIRRRNWKPTKSSRLCSQHFQENDYQHKPGCNKKLLKMDSVPSIFNFPKGVGKEISTRRVLVRKNFICNPDEELAGPVTPNIESDCEPLPLTRNVQTQATWNLEARNALLRRKLRAANEKLKRNHKKIESMEDLIKALKESSCTNENLTLVMENYFKGFPLELLVNQHKNENVAPGRRRYSDLIKQFAHTMYFYSPKAYKFLQQYFVLPNGRTIRKWLSALDCFPGFLAEVLEFLKSETTIEPHLRNCALILNGMSIRKQIIWDNSKGKIVGNIDYGGIVVDDHESPASEALFLQIVSYTNKFKLPVAYFLTNKANALIQSQIIMCCLRNLFEVGIVIRSVTCDGTTTNIETLRKLTECDLLGDKIYFFHPCDSDVKVYCIFDPCHMLKLARNCMAEKAIVSELGTISWTYIQKLHEIQGNTRNNLDWPTL